MSSATPSPEPWANVHTLTFDIFGTVLDLAGSLAPPAGEFLRRRGAAVDETTFWHDWRNRQRIEQYQDNLLLLGHSGYLETCRRAFVYCLKLHGVQFHHDEVDEFMRVYRDLRPYPDAVDGLRQLGERYALVALSNGEQWFLEHLAENNIKVAFNEIISVESVGAFKPYPAVYRKAAQVLGASPLTGVCIWCFPLRDDRFLRFRRRARMWVRKQQYPCQPISLVPKRRQKAICLPSPQIYTYPCQGPPPEKS